MHRMCSRFAAFDSSSCMKSFAPSDSKTLPCRCGCASKSPSSSASGEARWTLTLSRCKNVGIAASWTFQRRQWDTFSDTKAAPCDNLRSDSGAHLIAHQGSPTQGIINAQSRAVLCCRCCLHTFRMPTPRTFMFVNNEPRADDTKRVYILGQDDDRRHAERAVKEGSG